MKKYIASTVLFTLLITMPGYADCPSHTDKTDKHVTSVMAVSVVKSQSFATSAPKESWHDLHWFE